MPSGQSIYHQKRKRRRLKPPDLKVVLRDLADCLEDARLLREDAKARNDHETVLKTIHATNQVASTYGKLFETAELDEKLRAVESFIHDKKAQNQSFR
jgi:hypothetical protein